MHMDEGAAGSETELDPSRVAELVDAGAALVDTRRDYEWDGGRIPGARHVEMNEITAAVDSIPRDRPVIFYCRSGNRSRMIADAFRQDGYDAHNLAGGIQGWVAAGLEIEPEGGEIREPLPAS